VQLDAPSIKTQQAPISVIVSGFIGCFQVGLKVRVGGLKLDDPGGALFGGLPVGGELP